MSEKRSGQTFASQRAWEQLESRAMCFKGQRLIDPAHHGVRAHFVHDRMNCVIRIISSHSIPSQNQEQRRTSGTFLFDLAAYFTFGFEQAYTQ
jgi:hypothetical protein